MTEKPPLGFRWCTNPACGKAVHYKKAQCPHCSAMQIAPAPVVTPEPPPAADKPTADVIVHPSAPAAIVVEPYVVMQDFRQLLGNVVGDFRRDMVLSDHAMIQTLIESKAPICPVSQASGLACCPACKTVFPLPRKSAEKARVG